jgi:uncharacterized membrane protein
LSPLPFVAGVPGAGAAPVSLAPVLLAAKTVTGGNRTAYDVLIGLHVAAALIGFGAVAVNGAYGGHARRAQIDGPVGDTAMEELRRYFGPPGRAELLIFAVPFLGAAALAVKPGSSDFGQLWVAIGLALWVIATVLLFAVVRPSEAVLRRAAQAATQAPASSDAPSGAGLAAAGQRLQGAAAASDLIFLVALIVMVIQPGS